MMSRSSPSGSTGTSEEDFSTSHEYFRIPRAHTVERTSWEKGEKESPRKNLLTSKKPENRER